MPDGACTGAGDGSIVVGVGRPLAVLTALPLALLGGIVGHGLADRLVGPGLRPDVELLDPHGPGGGFVVPLVLLLTVAAALGALARGRSGVPPWRGLAVLPPLAFVVQEHVEAALAQHALPLDVVLAPSFLPGLAIQVPVALVCLLVARLLSRVVAAALRRHRRSGSQPRAVAGARLLPGPAAAPRRRDLDRRATGRAPPRVARPA